MNALGTHVMLELKACNPELLNDLPYLRDALLEAATSVKFDSVANSKQT